MGFQTIQWKGDAVKILDQRRLPAQVRYLSCKEPASVAMAIKEMAIRGAPAIGVAAAMGIALAARKSQAVRLEDLRREVEEACGMMSRTRPTAVNLFWAIERMRKVLERPGPFELDDLKSQLVEEALRIYQEDLNVNRKIGENGKGLVRDGQGVLTHCNAGALATAGYGTALGVIRAAWAGGKRFHVYVNETRPLFQGARLTAWELSQEGIPCTVITDSAAGVLMKEKRVHLVLVGADRIALNGDAANKIGTYGLAILASWHRIPFYVAAPSSTLDHRLRSGREIPIEERSEEEVTRIDGKRIAPSKVPAYNPAFDVTPHPLIKAIITEKGLIKPPFFRNLKRLAWR
ncbi:MAG: S-methyl-5-thioribose-1-phosphate isomerase [Desulfobacterota bacterium]|nr:S-methyl-5-thioribose-1-phosphate isomerase [Thermodesulfobacteriota bacterium]